MLMSLLGCADIIIVRNFQPLQYIFKFISNPVTSLLGLNALFFRTLLYFLTMLIQPSNKPGIGT